MSRGQPRAVSVDERRRRAQRGSLLRSGQREVFRSHQCTGHGHLAPLRTCNRKGRKSSEEGRKDVTPSVPLPSFFRSISPFYCFILITLLPPTYSSPWLTQMCDHQPRPYRRQYGPYPYVRQMNYPPPSPPNAYGFPHTPNLTPIDRDSGRASAQDAMNVVKQEEDDGGWGMTRAEWEASHREEVSRRS